MAQIYNGVIAGLKIDDTAFPGLTAEINATSTMNEVTDLGDRGKKFYPSTIDIKSSITTQVDVADTKQTAAVQEYKTGETQSLHDFKIYVDLDNTKMFHFSGWVTGFSEPLDANGHQILTINVQCDGELIATPYDA